MKFAAWSSRTATFSNPSSSRFPWTKAWSRLPWTRTSCARWYGTSCSTPSRPWRAAAPLGLKSAMARARPCFASPTLDPGYPNPPWPRSLSRSIPPSAKARGSAWPSPSASLKPTAGASTLNLCKTKEPCSPFASPFRNNMPKTRLLLVEDDQSLVTLLRLELERAVYQVDTVKNGERAIERLSKDIYDAVVTDLRLEGADGIIVLGEAKRIQPETEVLVMTGHGSTDPGVAAIKAGAFDYLTKPVEAEELLLVLKKALEHRSLVSEVRRLRAEMQGKYSFEGIVYASPAMHKVLELVKKVAMTDATVLISGESGTGKELIARAIHENSSRRAGM